MNNIIFYTAFAQEDHWQWLFITSTGDGSPSKLSTYPRIQHRQHSYLYLLSPPAESDGLHYSDGFCCVARCFLVQLSSGNRQC